MGLLNYNTLRPFSNQSGLPRQAKLYKERNGNIEKDISFGKLLGRTFQYQPSDSPEFWKDGGNLVDYTEDEMLYTVNEHGFRGKKIIQTDSILMTAGCSHTYGIGVNNAEVWGSNLADELDMYHINTGVGGIGPDTVALLIKQFFEEGIVPEILAILWPGVSRKMVVLEEQKSLDEQITDYIIQPGKNPALIYQYAVSNPLPEQKEHHNAVKGIQLQSEQQHLFDFWLNRELIIALCEKHNVKLIEGFLYVDSLDYVKERCTKRIPRTEFLSYPDYARDNMHFGYKSHRKLAEQFRELL